MPDKISICKCAAHTNDKSFISTGNARADMAVDQTEDNTKAPVAHKLTLILTFLLVYRACSLFPQELRKTTGRHQAAALLMASGDPLLERPVYPNISFNIMLS